jgi:TctA family transporter
MPPGESLMDVGLLSGLANALTLANIGFALIGCLLGTLVGILPGLGPASAMAILLPVALYLPADGAIIIMAGIYYGAMYGGSTTAILMNIPGEVASVITAQDGFAMTKQGRAARRSPLPPSAPTSRACWARWPSHSWGRGSPISRCISGPQSTSGWSCSR